jgi:hypothetical protein
VDVVLYTDKQLGSAPSEVLLAELHDLEMSCLVWAQATEKLKDKWRTQYQYKLLVSRLRLVGEKLKARLNGKMDPKKTNAFLSPYVGTGSSLSVLMARTLPDDK